jgi:hypothetical protein
MAARFYGVENHADLTEAQINIFSLIFIFSIAGIAACSGPLLAYLGTKNMIEEEVTKQPILKNALRKTLLSIRKRMKEPKIIREIEEVEIEKEVIKEVPVEKLVVRNVEIPKPFEVTKYVGVPVPKDVSDLPSIDEINFLEFPQKLKAEEVA